MTRKELIQYFTGDTGESEIISLHECLYCENRKDIDKWLKGVIESLFYAPNEILLVLVGPQAIGKTYFIRNLLPKEIKMFAENLTDEDLLYDKLIIDLDTESSKEMYKRICSTSLKHRPRYSSKIGADKRLASIVTTNNDTWDHPPRRRSVVLELEAIDKDLFNSIDKKVLWQQIFNKYKR